MGAEDFGQGKLDAEFSEFSNLGLAAPSRPSIDLLLQVGDRLITTVYPETVREAAFVNDDDSTVPDREPGDILYIVQRCASSITEVTWFRESFADKLASYEIAGSRMVGYESTDLDPTVSGRVIESTLADLMEQQASEGDPDPTLSALIESAVEEEQELLLEQLRGFSGGEVSRDDSVEVALFKLLFRRPTGQTAATFHRARDAAGRTHILEVEVAKRKNPIGALALAPRLTLTLAQNFARHDEERTVRVLEDGTAEYQSRFFVEGGSVDGALPSGQEFAQLSLEEHQMGLNNASQENIDEIIAKLHSIWPRINALHEPWPTTS